MTLDKSDKNKAIASLLCYEHCLFFIKLLKFGKRIKFILTNAGKVVIMKLTVFLNTDGIFCSSFLYSHCIRRVVNTLAQSTIQAVLQAENDTIQWENEAKEQAVSLVEQARQDAKELLRKTEEQAMEEKQQQIQKARNGAENTARDLQQQAQQQAQALQQQVQSRQKKAVREILRVVLS